jgi:hypothetical protein
MKVARTVRRGEVGKVPRGNSPAPYPTFFPQKSAWCLVVVDRQFGQFVEKSFWSRARWPFVYHNGALAGYAQF